MLPADLIQFHRKLSRWYKKHGRHELPWRNTCDPYAIYVSEVMLQQTQVKTVLERYYQPFLNRFPTLASLAKASEKDVLSAWQGLGYYRRAKNLHQTAKLSPKSLPNRIEALEEMPGIGKNTAHAIAAFAYHQPVAVMEANVKRVISRLYALKQPSTSELWRKASALVDQKNPFDYNQAMMDLGSMICTPKEPQCHVCPANDFCQGQTAPQRYPEPIKKASVPTRKKTIIVYRNKFGAFYAAPRESAFLSGLYHFVEHDKKPTNLTHKLGIVRQKYSHFTLDADVYLIDGDGRSGENWHSLRTLKSLPVSKAEEKIITMLEKLS